MFTFAVWCRRTARCFSIAPARDITVSPLEHYLQPHSITPTSIPGSLPATIPREPGLYTLLLLQAHTAYLSKAMSFFSKRTHTRSNPDVRLLSIVTGIYADNNGPDEAVRFLETFSGRSGTRPDTHCYNQILAHCARTKNVAAFHGVVQRMHHAGMNPNVFTYLHTMQIYVETGDGAKAMEVWDQARRMGLTPRRQMDRLLVSAYFLEGDVKGARRVLREAAPSQRMYTVVIQGLLRSGLDEEAFEVYDQMIEHGFEPNAVTYTMLMDIYAKRGDEDMVTKYFDEMVTSGHQPDAHTYGVLIWTALRVQRSYDVVLQHLRAMHAADIPLNKVIMATIIDGLCRLGMTDEAHTLLHAMDPHLKSPLATTSYIHATLKSYHLTPTEIRHLISTLPDTPTTLQMDVVTYTVLITAHTRTRQHLPFATVLLNEMLARNIQPDAAIFNALIAAHARHGTTESTLAVLTQMEEYAVRPTVETFTTLVWMYNRNAWSTPTDLTNLDTALTNIRTCLTSHSPRVSPDLRLFTTLARAYARRKDGPTLRRLIGEMTHLGIEADEGMWRLLLVACEGDEGAVGSVAREMVGRGVRIGEGGLRVLGKWGMRVRMVEGVVRVVGRDGGVVGGG